MPRLLYADPGSQLVYRPIGSALKSAIGLVATIWADAAATTLADVAEFDPLNPGTPGPVIVGSTLTVDTNSLLPWFWGPVAGDDTLWVTVGTGPIAQINAYYDPRIDAAATSAALAAEAAARIAGDAATLASANASAIQNAIVDAKGDLIVATAADAVARMAVGSNGYVPMAESSATPGIEWGDIWSMMGYLASGQENMIRLNVRDTTLSTATGRVRFAYFTARRTETVNSIRFFSGGTAAGATPSLVKFGLYSAAANGDLTRQGITASDTAIFASINTSYERAMTGSVALTRGTRYAVGVLVVTAAATPTLAGNTGVNGTSAEFGRAPRLASLIDGQADLAASYTAGSLSDTNVTPYAVAVP